LEATKRRSSATFGVLSLLALALGLVLGLFGFETGNPAVIWLATALQPLGVLWLNALQLAVLPLVVLQLLHAICGNGNGKSLAGVGKRTVLTIVLMAGGFGIASLFVSAPIVNLYSISPETVDAIRESVIIPTAAQARAGADIPSSLGSWLVSLVPTNIFSAALQGDLIQILLITVVFGLATNKLPAERRKPLTALYAAGADAVMIIVRWILVATPVGVFALVMGLALGTGSEAVGLLGAYVLMNQGVLLFFILTLYPISAILGRVSPKVFARAAVGPQIVAVTTRSSIASMPAQIDSGKKYLGFSETTSGFVVPLLVSTLKIQSTIQQATKVLFLSHIFGVSLSFGQLGTFMVAIILISFSSLGVPRGGSAFRTLPAYMAIGIPVEGLVLLQAIKDISDYGYTLANTTGQFSAATILSRGDRQKEQARQPRGDPLPRSSPQPAPATGGVVAREVGD